MKSLSVNRWREFCQPSPNFVCTEWLPCVGQSWTSGCSSVIVHWQLNPGTLGSQLLFLGSYTDIHNTLELYTVYICIYYTIT